MLIVQSYYHADCPNPPEESIGKAACADLAKRDPEKAVKNPDSYTFFALGEMPDRE